MWWKLFNIALYQMIWLSCVLGGTAGSLLGLGLIGLHLLLSAKKADDLKVIAILLATGCLLDGTLQGIGIITFTTGGWPIPLWLAVIWMGLALVVHHSLAWMKGRYLLCALFGTLGGPLAYGGGAALGAATFGRGAMVAMVVLGLSWALLWPLVMLLAARSNTT